MEHSLEVLGTHRVLQHLYARAQREQSGELTLLGRDWRFTLTLEHGLWHHGTRKVLRKLSAMPSFCVAHFRQGTTARGQSKVRLDLVTAIEWMLMAKPIAVAAGTNLACAPEALPIIKRGTLADMLSSRDLPSSEINQQMMTTALYHLDWLWPYCKRMPELDVLGLRCDPTARQLKHRVREILRIIHPDLGRVPQALGHDLTARIFQASKQYDKTAHLAVAI